MPADTSTKPPPVKSNGLASFAKTLIRLPFRLCGFDMVRWVPKKPEPPPVETPPRKQWMQLLGIQTILDVGAHQGEFARRIHQLLPDAKLVSFEPLTGPFQILKANLEQIPGARAIQCALGDRPGRMTIHRNEFAPSSSLLVMTDVHKKAFDFAVKQDQEEIEVRRLSDVARELEILEPLMIKLDVQGFEDKVILGGEDIVARAKLMIIETSFDQLYEGQPLFDDIYRMLKERGFTYAGNFEQLASPVDGRILQADAIFVRVATI